MKQTLQNFNKVSLFRTFTKTEEVHLQLPSYQTTHLISILLLFNLLFFIHLFYLFFFYFFVVGKVV